MKTSKLNKIKLKNIVVYSYSKLLRFGQINSSHPNEIQLTFIEHQVLYNFYFL